MAAAGIMPASTEKPLPRGSHPYTVRAPRRTPSGSTSFRRSSASWSSAGPDGGAGHRAVIATLTATCKLNGIGPQACIADVIAGIVNGHLSSRIDGPMPRAAPATATKRAVA
jgi:hypothetical protein